MMAMEPGSMGQDTLDALRVMSEERQRDIHKHYMRSQWRLLVTFVVVMLLAGVAHWWSLQLPSRPGPALVWIENLHSLGPTDLCPGDILHYSYEIQGRERVDIDINMTIWRLEPPQTVVYGMTRRDILIPPVNHMRDEMYVVPSSFIDPMRQEPILLSPGAYERRISVTTVGRNNLSASAALQFTIRDDCG